MPQFLTPNQIVQNNGIILSNGLSDDALTEFFIKNFQDIIDDRQLYPAWACLNCRNIGFGNKPNRCPECENEQLWAVGNFQSRAPATGGVFQAGVKYIFDNFYNHLEVISSSNTQFRDSCDLYVDNAVGVEVKGSPEEITMPNGEVVTFDRPGMRRSDTEKKANSNAVTFKEDHGTNEVRFYVITNAIPAAWHEEHSQIDGIYDATRLAEWETLHFDIEVDINRANRHQLGRR